MADTESERAINAALKKCVGELSAALESERATHAAVVVALKNRIGGLETENAEMRGLCGEALSKLLPIYQGTENMETALLLDHLKLVNMRGEGEL